MSLTIIGFYITIRNKNAQILHKIVEVILIDYLCKTNNWDFEAIRKSNSKFFE